MDTCSKDHVKIAWDNAHSTNRQCPYCQMRECGNHLLKELANATLRIEELVNQNQLYRAKLNQ